MSDIGIEWIRFDEGLCLGVGVDFADFREEAVHLFDFNLFEGGSLNDSRDAIAHVFLNSNISDNK